jgi:anti-sigma factor RsiW
MNDRRYQTLRETSWRRELSPGEEAELRSWLADHPDQASDWERELDLNLALNALAEVPVPTNFTARVLEAASRGGAGGWRLDWGWKRRWRLLAPGLATAAVAVAVGLLVHLRLQESRRAELARALATVSGVAAVPDPAVLRDFDAIRRLGQTPPADEELLALMK